MVVLGIVVLILIGLLVAAWCKVAGRESRREEQQAREEKVLHPCDYCHRWGECNGVDESCPLLQAYEEKRKRRGDDG